jgi:organic radical activating enzyme
MIPISEIFYSLQGEGRYCGCPSVFVRVGGCNLKCRFNSNGCDSYYAVDEKFKSEWRLLSIEDIKKEIKRYFKFNPHLVITGGEPMIYYKELYPLIEWFKGVVTVETNATIRIDFDTYPKYKEVVFAMSVKLSNSKEDYTKRVKKDVIASYAKNAKNSFFKFVVDRDLKDEILDITNKFDLPIYCMPMGASKEEIEKNSKFVFEFCLKNGFCYSDRIHIRIFGKKKGV